MKKPLFNPYAKKSGQAPSTSHTSVTFSRSHTAATSARIESVSTAEDRRSSSLAGAQTRNALLIAANSPDRHSIQFKSVVSAVSSSGLSGTSLPPKSTSTAYPSIGVSAAPASYNKPLSLKAQLKADIEKIKRENQHRKRIQQEKKMSRKLDKQKPKQSYSSTLVVTSFKSTNITLLAAQEGTGTARSNASVASTATTNGASSTCSLTLDPRRVSLCQLSPHSPTPDESQSMNRSSFSTTTDPSSNGVSSSSGNSSAPDPSKSTPEYSEDCDRQLTPQALRGPDHELVQPQLSLCSSSPTLQHYLPRVAPVIHSRNSGAVDLSNGLTEAPRVEISAIESSSTTTSPPASRTYLTANRVSMSATETENSLEGQASAPSVADPKSGSDSTAMIAALAVSAPKSSAVSSNPASAMAQQLIAAKQHWQPQLPRQQVPPLFGFPTWNPHPPSGDPTQITSQSLNMYPNNQPYPLGAFPNLNMPMGHYWASNPLYARMMMSASGGGPFPYPWHPSLVTMAAPPHHFGGYRNKPAAGNESKSSSARIKQPGSGALAASPLNVPSPYAYSHERINGTIVLIKTPSNPKESSFGVTLKTDVQSALVSQEWLQANGYTMNIVSPSRQDGSSVKLTDSLAPSGPAASGMDREKPDCVTTLSSAAEDRMEVNHSGSTISVSETEATTQPKPKSRAQRRKRWFFSTLMVQDASLQNSRRLNDASKHLNPGDIILEIDGRPTAGLTFQQAVGLLKDISRVDEDGVVRCPIILARRRAPVVKSRPLVSAAKSGPTNPLTRKGPLTIDELVVFVNCMIKSLTDPMRTLGRPLTDDHFLGLTQMNEGLSSLSVTYIKGLWKGISAEVERIVKDNAVAHWTLEWQKEPHESKVPGVDFISDAQRASLRSLPRPAKGCRCGASDHEYVNDIKCPLYSNLRHHSPSLSDVSNTGGYSSTSSKLPSDLNAVEKAFKDRFVKLRSEQKAQEAEAKFVAQMEEIQLGQRNQAVFAPSLESMVLSGVAELQQVIKDLALDPLPSQHLMQPSTLLLADTKQAPAIDDDDSDDDDDVPLAQLGKRPSKTELIPIKKSREEVSIRHIFLAKLLNALSSKWGHVFSEPSDEEYAWRWEVYHGQTSSTGSRWDANSRNPRKPGSLTLENVRFGITNNFPVNCEMSLLSSTEKLAPLKMIATLLSPDHCGVIDELLALIRMKVVSVDEFGVPRLTEDWWEHVDLLILEDMNNHWGIKVDPQGKFGIVDEIRLPLAEKWRRTRDGWVMNDERDELVFDFDEFDVWREAFEEKQQEEQDDDEGIGKFGI